MKAPHARRNRLTFGIRASIRFALSRRSLTSGKHNLVNDALRNTPGNGILEIRKAGVTMRSPKEQAGRGGVSMSRRLRFFMMVES